MISGPWPGQVSKKAGDQVGKKQASSVLVPFGHLASAHAILQMAFLQLFVDFFLLVSTSITQLTVGALPVLSA